MGDAMDIPDEAKFTPPKRALVSSRQRVPTYTVGEENKRRCTEGALPDFPWPVPSPSARMALPDNLLQKARGRDDGRLRHAANELDAMLLSAGYSERSYFRLRKDDQTVGFALVTRMERIRKDGTPYPQRDRFLPVGADERFNVIEFLKSLFIAPIGYYRVLVFTVSREPVRADGPGIGSAVADKWLATGGTRLLGCVAELPFSEDFGVDALIYEFRHAPEETLARHRGHGTTRVSQLIPSKLDPALHLRRAGILDSASRQRQP